MKNILYIHDARFVSGLEKVILNISKTIDAKRFTPFFIVSKWSDGYFIRLAGELKMKYAVTNLGFIARTYNPFILMKYFLNMLVSSVDIYNFINKNKIDIISANSLQDAFYSFLPALISKTPIIWHQHAIRKRTLIRLIISMLNIKIKKYFYPTHSLKCLLYLKSFDIAQRLTYNY